MDLMKSGASERYRIKPFTQVPALAVYYYLQQVHAKTGLCFTMKNKNYLFFTKSFLPDFTCEFMVCLCSEVACDLYIYIYIYIYISKIHY